MAMGVQAARDALADAGVAWERRRSSRTAAARTRATPTRWSPISARPAFRSSTSRTAARRAARRSSRRSRRSQSGAYEIGLVVGFDKHPRGAFQNDPADWSLPAWYGEIGLMITTQFFGAKLQRYMHDYAIPIDTLAQVAEKAFANGSITPHAWRRRALSAEEILGFADARASAHAVHAVLARRGRRRARRLPARVPEQAARRAAGLAAVRRRCGRGAPARSRCSARRSVSRSPTRRPWTPSRRGVRGGRRRPGGRRRRAGAGHGVGSGADPSRRVRPVRARRADRAVRARRHAHRRRPAGEHGRRLPRERRAGRRVRACARSTRS